MEQGVRQGSYVGFLGVAVRRHLVLVIVLTLVVLAGAAAYAYSRPARYTSTVTLLPRPATGNPLAPDTAAASGAQLTVAMLTEAGLVDTPAVAARASKSLGVSVPRRSDKITAAVPPNTQIIKITYVSGTAQHAEEGAQAFAVAFLAYRKGVTVAAQQELLTSLDGQVAATTDDLRKATKAAAVLGGNSFASQQVLLYSNRLADLRDSISSAEALSTDPGVVVSAASKPKAPVGVSPLVITVGGGILGLVLALVLVARLEWRRDVVDSTTDYDVCGVPLLAKLSSGSRQRSLITDADPDAVSQEVYRRMRAGFIAIAGPPKVIAVSCVSGEESSGDVAVNLAISLALAGFRVTVVAADPYDRTPEVILGASPSPGLAEVVAGTATLAEAVQQCHQVDFLAGGRAADAVRELLAGPALAAVVDELRNTADYVIVASARTASSDADAVALACDGVIIIVNDGFTTHAQTTEALDRYQRLEVSAIGAVSIPGRPHRGGAGSRRGTDA